MRERVVRDVGEVVDSDAGPADKAVVEEAGQERERGGGVRRV